MPRYKLTYELFRGLADLGGRAYPETARIRMLIWGRACGACRSRLLLHGGRRIKHPIGLDPSYSELLRAAGQAQTLTTRPRDPRADRCRISGCCCRAPARIGAAVPAAAAGELGRDHGPYHMPSSTRPRGGRPRACSSSSHPHRTGTAALGSIAAVLAQPLCSSIPLDYR